MPPPLEAPTGSSRSPPPPPKRLPVIDTSAPALAASLRKLRDIAGAAVDAQTAPDLRRADRLLLKGGGAVMEDIQLGASVAVGAARGLVRDKAGLTPRETSLGSTVWGRRASAQPFTVAVRAAIAVVAVLGMCVAYLPPRLLSLLSARALLPAALALARAPRSARSRLAVTFTC